MGQRHRIAGPGEIESGSGRTIDVGGKKIAVFHSGESYHAIDDACTHAGASLCEGSVEASKVTCPWHGAVFDLETGKVLSGPDGGAVGVYAVHVEGDGIYVELP